MKNSSHHHNSAKAGVAFFILLLGFGILLLFVTYQDSLLSSGAFNQFIILVTIVMGLLLGLLYLANNSKHTPSKTKTTKAPVAAKKSTKTKKKKK